MASRRTTLNSLLRSLAAVTLLGWLAALAVCSLACLGGNAHCQPKHHEEQAATHPDHDHDQAPDSDKHGDCPDTSVCDSLKTLAPASHSDLLPKPDFSLLTWAFVSLPHSLVAGEQDAPISRQPPDREFVFTPVVCLGPAFRSLAPPVLL